MFQGSAFMFHVKHLSLHLCFMDFYCQNIPFFNLKMKNLNRKSIIGKTCFCVSCIYRNLLILIERDHPPVVIASSQFIFVFLLSAPPFYVLWYTTVG